jgi:hypothetical protein
MAKKNKPQALLALTKPLSFQMRLSAGKHAVKASEAEVLIDGARVTGGEGTFEFDLFAETWIEVRVLR